MQWKLLPPDDWHRIKTELPDSPLALLETYDDLNGVIVVVENDAGQIVGHWPLLLTMHAEPLYLLPAYRKSGPALKHLLDGLFSTMYASDVPNALVIIEDPDLQAAAARLGFQRVPGELYIATAPAPPEEYEP